MTTNPSEITKSSYLDIDLYDIPSRDNNNTYDIPISISRPQLLSASSESSDEIRCDSSCHLSDDSVRKRLSDEEMAEYSSDSIELDAIRVRLLFSILLLLSIFYQILSFLERLFDSKEVFRRFI